MTWVSDAQKNARENEAKIKANFENKESTFVESFARFKVTLESAFKSVEAQGLTVNRPGTKPTAVCVKQPVLISQQDNYFPWDFKSSDNKINSLTDFHKIRNRVSIYCSIII